METVVANSAPLLGVKLDDGSLLSVMDADFPVIEIAPGRLFTLVFINEDGREMTPPISLAGRVVPQWAESLDRPANQGSPQARQRTTPFTAAGFIAVVDPYRLGANSALAHPRASDWRRFCQRTSSLLRFFAYPLGRRKGIEFLWRPRLRSRRSLFSNLLHKARIDRIRCVVPRLPYVSHDRSEIGVALKWCRWH